MNSAVTLLSVALLWSTASAQDALDPLEALIKTADSWVQANLDEQVLDALKGSGVESSRYLFTELNRRLQNNNIYDLGPLKGLAGEVLPLLQQSKATRPYAEWLKTHMDYLEASDQLRRRVQTNSPKSGVPAPRLPSPTPEAQRSVWERQLEKRPIPPGARMYVPRLKSIFQAGGVPVELVWLAEVESSFNPEARSPAGAAGLFQFMPVTARSVGLLLSPKDERLDPEKSARAAAKYLRYLQGRFNDWRLTLAAYNCGETRVAGLLTRNKTRNYFAIAPELPSETQLYVPKLEATLRRREGVALTSLTLGNGPAAR